MTTQTATLPRPTRLSAPPAGSPALSPVRLYDKPWLFYLLATAIPWAFWFGAAWLSNLADQTDLVRVLTAALGLAGLIAPVAVVGWFVWRKPALWPDITKRLIWPRGVRPSLLVASVVVMPASLLLATAVSVMFGGSVEQFTWRDGFTFTAGILPVWVTLIGAAVLEEVAWHSYGTDALVNRMRVFTASMLFTVIWAVWHLPLALIKGYYHQEMVEQGWLQTLNFPLSMVAFVLVMNWLYFRCGRSILVPVVVHLTANLANEVLMTDPDTKLIQTGLLLVLAAVVVVKERDLFFGRPERSVRPAR